MDDLYLKADLLKEQLFESYLVATEEYRQDSSIHKTAALQKAKSELADHLLICKAMSKQGTAAVLELSARNPLVPKISFSKAKVSSIIKDISKCGYLSEEVVNSFLGRLSLKGKVLPTLDLDEAEKLLESGHILLEQYEAVLAIAQRKKQLQIDIETGDDIVRWQQPNDTGDTVDIKDF